MSPAPPTTLRSDFHRGSGRIFLPCITGSTVALCTLHDGGNREAAKSGVACGPATHCGSQFLTSVREPGIEKLGDRHRPRPSAERHEGPRAAVGRSPQAEKIPDPLWKTATTSKPFPTPCG